MVLEGLRKSLDNAIRKLRKLPIIDKEAIAGFIADLQRSLIEGDVNVDLAIAVTESIKNVAFDQHLSEERLRDKFIIKLVHDQLTRFLGEKPAPIRIQKGKENIILLVGIQGSGKTTTIAKLANYYKKRNFKIGLVCTDTWRPGAYEQLSQLGERIEVPVYGNPDEKDALKLARDGVVHFFQGKEDIDLVLVDSAGRHKEEDSLMKEMKDIESKLKPNETILIVDGTLGQQAYNQALAFARTTSVGSIIVTKLDGTAKGGGALSACAATGAKIKFIGTGEDISEFEIFKPSNFVGELLGVPNIEGILEEVEEAGIDLDFDSQKRIMGGKLTLVDFMQILRQFKKMGNIGKFLRMLSPGMALPPEFTDIAKGQLKKWETVISSMTQYEKENPKNIKGTRLTRIAIGSGCGRPEIKKLLAQFDMMNKFMKKFGKKGMKGGLPGMLPGMGSKGFPGLPGGKLPKGFKM
ncbi:MAG: signal recognition particle receptor subunit alpha [Candidatus Hodarchaeota archaeon]